MNEFKATKALVLNSGGCDSSTLVSLAVKEFGADNVITASLYYGQKHDKELKCAKDIAEFYGVKHIEEDISCVMKYAGEVCSLIKGSKDELIDKSYAEQIAENGSPNSEVPFRNGLFLSIAAAYAISLFPHEEVAIFYGAHADDAAGNAYPDCTSEFADAMDNAIMIGSRNKVRLIRPLINKNKSQVVSLGLKLGTPYHLTTSCYHGRDKACGVCGTCRDRIAAFKANHTRDPIDYEIDIDWEEDK